MQRSWGQIRVPPALPADSCGQQLFKSWRPGHGPVSIRLLEARRGPAEGRGRFLVPWEMSHQHVWGQGRPLRSCRRWVVARTGEASKALFAFVFPSRRPAPPALPSAPCPLAAFTPPHYFCFTCCSRRGRKRGLPSPHSCPALPWLRGREPEQLGQPASSIVVPGHRGRPRGGPGRAGVPEKPAQPWEERAAALESRAGNSQSLFLQSRLPPSRGAGSRSHGGGGRCPHCGPGGSPALALGEGGKGRDAWQAKTYKQ